MVHFDKILINNGLRDYQELVIMKRILFVLIVPTLFVIGGCGNPTPGEIDQSKQVQDQEPALMVINPLEYGADDTVRASEVQQVEQMVSYRNNYIQALEKLGRFYDAQGNHLKAVWVKNELRALAAIEMRPYIVLAEVAGPDLRASEIVAQADELFARAVEIIGSSRGIFKNTKRLLEARAILEELISTYPDSDKIDDAAWEIAEIYRRDLNDNYVAMLYYQRVWQWYPQNPYPARFTVAKIYDDFFHNYTKASEYYERSIQLEPGYTANVAYAKSRLKAINSK